MNKQTINVVHKVSSQGWFVCRINFIVFIQLISDQQNSFCFQYVRIIWMMLTDWCHIKFTFQLTPNYKLQTTRKDKEKKTLCLQGGNISSKMLNCTCTLICFSHILLSQPSDKSLLLVILNKCVRPLMSVEVCCCCLRSFTYQPHVSRGY